MELKNSLLPFFRVDMRVNLSGEYAFMTEHFLYNTQVGPILHQMRGKRVSESVRGNVFAYSCYFRLSANNNKNHFPCEPTSVAVQKKNILRSLCYRTCVAYTHIDGDAPYCRLSDRYQTLLGTLAGDSDKLLGKKEITDAKTHQFAHSQSAGVEYLNDGLIALPFAFRKVK